MTEKRTHWGSWLYIFCITTMPRARKKKNPLLKSDTEGLLGELDQTRRIQKCTLRGLPLGPSFSEGLLFQRSPAVSVRVTACHSPALLCVTGSLTPASPGSLVIGLWTRFGQSKALPGDWRLEERRGQGNSPSLP